MQTLWKSVRKWLNTPLDTPIKISINFGLIANLSYAGMRAQNHTDTKQWHPIAFTVGFPATLVSFLFVQEGSGRCYGIKLPK